MEHQAALHPSIKANAVHHNAGHPHIHIVTTNIASKRKRIDMQNIGRDKSETARRAIEAQEKKGKEIAIIAVCNSNYKSSTLL